MALQKDNGKHAQILDAAIVEIACSGYHRTTVARIARRAGVADGVQVASSEVSPVMT